MKKYFEIENSYRKKFIDFFLNIFPELNSVDYIIQEKYDGANISMVFDNKEDVAYKICSRNQVLDPKDSFFDVFNVVRNYPDLIDYGIKTSLNFDRKVIFFCELFGKGIQNRIDYGPDKYIKLFDVWIDGIGFLPQVIIKENDVLSKYYVNYFDIVSGLENAIGYTNYLFENDKIEGFVIKPYNKVYINSHDVFYIKKKTKKFSEKSKPKKSKPKVEYSKEINDLKYLFTTYINKNRALSAFSKIGEIENPKDIGKYIVYILEDAKKDFIKEIELDLNKFTKKEEKFIFNVSKQIVKILEEFL